MRRISSAARWKRHFPKPRPPSWYGATARSFGAASPRPIRKRSISRQEAERRRIAVELHDSTGQHLIAIQRGLSAIERGESSVEVSRQTQQSIAEAQREIRTLSYLLHPPPLTRHGLRAALQSFTTGFAKRTGTDVRLELRGAVNTLRQEVQHAVFRIVQEAFTNVVRHSQATQITVAVSRDAATLRLTVTDNGPPRRPGPLVPGVGLAGMSARVRDLDGTFDVDGSGGGVAIRAVIPLRR